MATSSGWGERIAAAHRAAQDATAHEEQIIRDARAAQVSVADVCRALGTKYRNRVYAIEGRGVDGGEVIPPQLTPLVYLRGAGCKNAMWERVEQAMWARGWDTERDHTTAWHAARGGVPVVMCDFSSGLDRGTGAWHDHSPYVRVGRVRARYQDSVERGHVQDLLTTNDAGRLIRDRADWLEEVVEVRSTEMRMQLTNGGEYDEPLRHDPDVESVGGWRGAHMLHEHKLAGLVAAALVN